MSSAQNKPHQSAKSASPPESKADIQTPPVAQPPSSESHMDHALDSPLTATPPAPSIPSEVMSSTETTDTTPSLSPAPIPPKPPSPETSAPSTAVPPAKASTPTAPESPTVAESTKAEASKPAAPKMDAPKEEGTPDEQPDNAVKDAESQAKDLSRQQPIPPASEPMQYRAIGLVRGKYVASEDQFTRGTVETDDGVTLGAVLLGRVMSLVKKHLDLEQPHLWVVYPRTREKGDADLHVQIVGVWEPEKLSRMDSDLGLDEEEALEPQDEEAQSETPVEPVEGESSDSTADLDDKYFSVRGEVVYQSIEENRILVKIRRVPRPGSDESKAFKVALNGTLEGKAVGYFWDLNVQRQGIDLVVQDGTMIGAVPPQKRSKKPFRDGGKPYRRGGPGGGRPGGGRPGGGRPGGGKPRWNNAPRDGQPRPTRGDRPSAPSPNRPPASKPVIKRRQQENSEEG